MPDDVAKQVAAEMRQAVQCRGNNCEADHSIGPLSARAWADLLDPPETVEEIIEEMKGYDMPFVRWADRLEAARKREGKR